jgi:hypothetical protein
MQEIRRFWRSLEVLGCGGAVRAEWQRLLGDEMSAVQTLLRPTGELALAYPHNDPDQLYYRVVAHGPDDLVGVCDETGERIVLTTADLVIESIDLVAFYRAVADALGVVAEPRPVDGLHWTMRIGQYIPLAGYRFSVYLIVAQRQIELDQALDRLIALDERPFILLAPSARFLLPGGEERLRRRQACFLALDDSVAVDNGRMLATPAATRIMGEFRQRHLPDTAEMAAAAQFPTPGGATWGQIKIHLIDGHTASISLGPVRQICTYAQMGMANRKNGAPSVQWELLRIFAAADGLLTWRSAGADRRNQKRRELLVKALRQFFRLEGDPIQTCGNGWKTRFQIEGLV